MMATLDASKPPVDIPDFEAPAFDLPRLDVPDFPVTPDVPVSLDVDDVHDVSVGGRDPDRGRHDDP